MLTYRRRGEGSVEVDRALELDTKLGSKFYTFLSLNKSASALNSSEEKCSHDSKSAFYF